MPNLTHFNAPFNTFLKQMHLYL